jgi:hypothetical protein
VQDVLLDYVTCAASADMISAMGAKGTLIFFLKFIFPNALGEPVSHENSIFVKEVVTHSYREYVSTSLGIWVYGDIHLSARDMAALCTLLQLSKS